MLSIGVRRVFMYCGPVDMRRSFDGLSALVEEAFGKQLLSGSFFVFINRRRDRVKVLYWDADGLVLWYKRLEKGRFIAPQTVHSEISRRQFLMLIEGIEAKRLHRRYEIEKR